MKYDVKSVSEYLKVIPSERKRDFGTVRKLIKELAPDVKESYEHNMPFYRLNGEPLFALASQKHNLSLYVTEVDIVAKHKDILGQVSLGKSCIRFKSLEKANVDGLIAVIDQSYQRRNT